MSRERGLLDFVVTVLTCALVYLHTPLGALVDTPIRWVFGGNSDTRALTSFFDFDAGGDGPTDEELQTIADLRRELRGDGTHQRAADNPATLVRALQMALGDQTVPLNQDQRVRAARLSGGEISNLGYAAALVRDDQTRFGSLDAALCALRLGEPPVERAIDIARDREPGRPAQFEVFSRYLTRAQRREVSPFINRVMAIYTALDFEWPVATSARITSPFGYRMHPVLGKQKFHNGVDLAVRTGTEVVAAHSGRVSRADFDAVNGNYAIIKHGYGLQTGYAHASELLVSQGDLLARSQQLLRSGNTGRSTGPHLHWTVRIGGRAVDPAMFGPD